MKIKKTISIKPSISSHIKNNSKIKYLSKAKSKDKTLSSLLISHQSASIRQKKQFKSIQSLSYTILSAHSIPKNQFNIYVISSILNEKTNHYNSMFNDMKTFISPIEYLKRYYITKESKERLSKYFCYYKNYLHFFCRPNISDLKMNSVMMKNMEKVAQVFYNNNYNNTKENNNHNKNSNKNKKHQNLLFTEGVVGEIEKISQKNSGINLDKEFLDTSNTLSNINCLSINDLSTINPKSSAILENKSTTYNTSSNNTNVKAFSLDQTLNTSINALLSIMNQTNLSENEKSQRCSLPLTRIKKPIKLNNPSSPSKLLLNAYNNFNFPINLGGINYKNMIKEKTRINSNSPIGHNFHRFKVNSGSMKNIFSKNTQKLPQNLNNINNNSIISKIKNNYIPLVSNPLYNKTPINNYTNTLFKTRSTSNINNRPQTRLSILSSPTLAPRGKKTHNFVFSNKGSKIDSPRLFSTGRDKRRISLSKKSLEESTRASGNEQINIPMINNIKSVYPNVVAGNLTSMNKDFGRFKPSKIKTMGRINIENIKRNGNHISSSTNNIHKY